jgi:GT2 family glycosyltransferase
MPDVREAQLTLQQSCQLASVVIPTYQGRESLERTLKAFTTQTLPFSQFEVIVSIDGSNDGTDELVSRLATPYLLRVVYSPVNRGRAAACNRGIRESRGDLVVILDDDMEPEPSLLERHLHYHANRARCGVIGAVPISYDKSSSAAAKYVGAKFNRHLENLSRPETPIHCRDFYSGNFSVRRDVLNEAGLFDESFTIYGNEDVELGLRLVNCGVELVFAADARARQHYDKSLARLAADETAKGRSAVLLATKHPDSLPYMRLATYHRVSLKWRGARAAMLWCTRVFPSTSDRVVRCLNWLERWDAAMLQRIFPLMLDYFFWIGASSALRTNRQASALLQALFVGQRH